MKSYHLVTFFVFTGLIASSTQEIFATCAKLKIKCIKQKNIKSANHYLLESIKPDRIIVTGSLYLIGKARKLFV